MGVHMELHPIPSPNPTHVEGTRLGFHHSTFPPNRWLQHMSRLMRDGGRAEGASLSCGSETDGSSTRYSTSKQDYRVNSRRMKTSCSSTIQSKSFSPSGFIKSTLRMRRRRGE